MIGRKYCEALIRRLLLKRFSLTWRRILADYKYFITYVQNHSLESFSRSFTQSFVRMRGEKKKKKVCALCTDFSKNENLRLKKKKKNKNSGHREKRVSYHFHSLLFAFHLNLINQFKRIKQLSLSVLLYLHAVCTLTFFFFTNWFKINHKLQSSYEIGF